MNNKIIRTLIPVVAVIIIFESVMLVSSLEKNNTSATTNRITPTIVKENVAKEVSAVDVSFLTETPDMKVGKKYKVSVNLMPQSSFNLNALSLFVKIDPNLMTISNLVSAKELPRADFIKVSDKKNVIATTFLFAAKDGVAFTKDKGVTFLTFDVVPKKTGVFNFEISTGDSDGDSVTMFVDKVTSKRLPFSSNKLEVNLMN